MTLKLKNKWQKIILYLTPVITFFILVLAFRDIFGIDEDNSKESGLSLIERIKQFFSSTKTETQPINNQVLLASLETSTAPIYANIFRLITTEPYTIPAGNIWVNVQNNGENNTATLNVGNGEMKLYQGQAYSYHKRNNDGRLSPQMVVNPNENEVLIEYSKN